MRRDRENPGTFPVIRPYLFRDQPGVCRLRSAGLLAGQQDPQASETALDDIPDIYLSAPSGRFWVADMRGQIVGTVAVAHSDTDVAYIRRLRVAPDWQQTSLACRLVETAVEHCVRHSFLKVVLHTHVHPERAVPILATLGYQYAQRSLDGNRSLEFYLDLYRKPSRSRAR